MVHCFNMIQRCFHHSKLFICIQKTSQSVIQYIGEELLITPQPDHWFLWFRTLNYCKNMLYNNMKPSKFNLMAGFDHLIEMGPPKKRLQLTCKASQILIGKMPPMHTVYAFCKPLNCWLTRSCKTKLRQRWRFRLSRSNSLHMQSCWTSPG